ncbi:phospholipase D-like domain-containing protein [Massilia sp. H-1]|nr:phospholipase D-like domain-containing protein [Massilia sp. H-1]
MHAGYAKWRKSLVESGITLLELKRTWPRGSQPRRARTSGGSSGSSLHAKTIAVDQKRMFVGSFNFDYRSADLNTEMGFVIDSPALAARMSDVLGQDVLKRSRIRSEAGAGRDAVLDRTDPGRTGAA